jgi:hypothetical protein
MRWGILALGLLAVSGASSGPDGSFGAVFFPDPPVELTTPAFQKDKGFSTQEEVVQWFNQLPTNLPNAQVEPINLGTSPRGRSIVAFRVNGSDPVANPVRIWVQGALHGDEQATTDGVMQLVEMVLRNPELANGVELMVVPIANPDGYARAMRQSASGMDLNRDMMMRQGPENQLIMAVFKEFQPEVALDFHEYRPYRSDFTEIGSRGVTAYYDNMFLGSSNVNIPEVLRAEIAAYVDGAATAAAQWGYRTHAYFVPEDDRGSMRMRLGSASPRSTATNYALHNCVSALIETRGVGQGRSALKRRVHSMAVIGMAYVQKAAADPVHLRTVLDAAHRDPMGPVIELNQPIDQRRYTFIDLAKRDTASWMFATRNYAQMQPRVRRPKPKFYALDKAALTPELIRSGFFVNQETKSLNQKAMAYEVTQRTEGLGANNQRTQKVVCIQVPTTVKGEFLIVAMDDIPSRLWYELFEPELDNSLVRNGLIECSVGKQLPYYAIYEETN